MHYFPRHIGDYSAEALPLCLTEDCMYRRMEDLYYQLEKPLNANKSEIYWILRATTKIERSAIDRVLSRFFTKKEDGFHHERWDKTLASMLRRKEANRRNGRFGGRPIK